MDVWGRHQRREGKAHSLVLFEKTFKSVGRVKGSNKVGIWGSATGNPGSHRHPEAEGSEPEDGGARTRRWCAGAQERGGHLLSAKKY